VTRYPRIVEDRGGFRVETAERSGYLIPDWELAVAICVDLVTRPANERPAWGEGAF
jgi:hypothetical protein